jgi:hypothetical protein
MNNLRLLSVSQSMPDYQRTAVFALIILFFVCANLIGPWLFWDAYKSDFVENCAYFATGGLIAEFCLLAIWCALGAQSFVLRVPLTTALVIVAACCFVLGLQVPEQGMPRGLGIFLIVAAPLMFACIQVPIWILRAATQQQIDVEAGGANTTGRTTQFGMRHLLIGMAVVGLLLVLVRHSLPPGVVDGPDSWFAIIAGGLTFIGFSAAICLPCVFLALGDRRRGLWALLLVLVIVFGPLLVFAALMVIDEVEFYEAAEVVQAVFIFGLGTAATLILVLLAVRDIGYRLVSPRAPVIARPASPRDPKDLRDRKDGTDGREL